MSFDAKRRQNAKRLDPRKAQRRAFQKNPTRRTGVHPPPPEPVPEPEPEQAPIDGKSGMIGPRIERATKRLVESMRDCPGASFETHAEACGIGLTTFYRWMANGLEEPEGIYGRFRTAMLKAMAKGEKVLHKAAMKTHAIHLLARRFPQHYPSERQLMEISGANGAPLIPAPVNSFSVVLELDPSSPPLPEREFEIEYPDGHRERWNSNGQKLNGNEAQ